MSDERLFAELGIPADYGTDPPLPRYAEAIDLVEAGPNIIGKDQRLRRPTAAAWRRMKTSAATDGIELLLVSGYRSIAHQAELIRSKLSAGRSIDDILKTNAAPGYSQHHTGRAIDVTTRGARPLTDEFEATSAFAWLTDNALRFGFKMPYYRGNPFGIAYEPWHWSQLDD